jgi:hypothetical protein
VVRSAVLGHCAGPSMLGENRLFSNIFSINIIPIKIKTHIPLYYQL